MSWANTLKPYFSNTLAEGVMAKATLFVLIAVAAGLLVYLLAAPRFVRVDTASRGTQPQGMRPSQPATTPAGRSNLDVPSTSPHIGSAADSVDNAPPIEVPLTSEQRSQNDLEARRGSLYAWIRDNMQGFVVGWQPSSADPATLDLNMSRTGASDISVCMNKLVEPYAARYGFNHVSFFVPNLPTESDQWRLDSEATPDESGTWHLYKK